MKDFLDLVKEAIKDYDTHFLVGLSGGKDSLYLLNLLNKEFSVKAYTLDTGFLSPIAKKNIEKITSRLGIGLIKESPPKSLFRKIYSSLLRHSAGIPKIEMVCEICSLIYESGLLRKASELKIPLTALGYSPYQIDHFEVPEKKIRKSWFPKEIEDMPLTPHERYYFWNPKKTEFYPRMMFPFKILGYDYDNIKNSVEKLGFRTNPLETNCLINEILMISDHEFYGKTLYDAEFDEMKKRKAISNKQFTDIKKEYNKMLASPELRGRVRKTLHKLNLKKEDINH